MEAKMKEVKKELKELFSKAKPEDYAEIKNDVELARGRYSAVRLVMTKTAAPASLQGGHEGGDRISLLELITEETIELSDGTHIRNDREASGGASDQQRLQESLAKLRSRPKAAASPPQKTKRLMLQQCQLISRAATTSLSSRASTLRLRQRSSRIRLRLETLEPLKPLWQRPASLQMETGSPRKKRWYAVAVPVMEAARFWTTSLWKTREIRRSP